MSGFIAFVGLCFVACGFAEGSAPVRPEKIDTKSVGRNMGIGMLLLLCGLVGMLAGCAGTLPVLSSGLDAAKPVIAQACPERTPTCERVLASYNAGISAYNLAVLAEAVGEDASQLKAQGLASLKSLWAALQDVAK